MIAIYDYPEHRNPRPITAQCWACQGSGYHIVARDFFGNAQAESCSNCAGRGFTVSEGYHE